MKKVFMILVVASLVITCLSVIGCGGKKTTTKTVTTTTVPTSETTSQTDKTTIVNGSVGDTVKIGNLEIKVISWKFDTWAGVGFPDEPNNKPVVIDLEVVNNSQKSVGGNESIITQEGYSYTRVWTAPDPGFPQSDIEPNEKGKGFVTVQVPNDVKSMTFQYEEYQAGKARIKLQ